MQDYHARRSGGQGPESCLRWDRYIHWMSNPRAGDGTVSIARALSKLGLCSRSEGERLVRTGRVSVDGRRIRDIAHRLNPERSKIEIDESAVGESERLYVALNKPRGLVTTRSDPAGRATIYQCFDGANLPFLAPVGRLDKASEGLLLLTNDSRWSARILEPESGVEKVYHVQVQGVPSEAILAQLAGGVVDEQSGEALGAVRVALLRVGSRSSFWLEITLDEGKNRQIRRMLSAVGLEVKRLIRVSVGPLALGALAKGAWRHLTVEEVQAIAAS